MQRKQPTTPIASRSDAAIEQRAQSLTHIVETLTGVPQDAASLVERLTRPGILTHDTLRTSSLPGIERGASVSHAERARAMGGASSEAASWPAEPNGPQGCPESLKARRALIAYVVSQTPPIRSHGLPGSKAERRAERARKHKLKMQRGGK